MRNKILAILLILSACVEQKSNQVIQIITTNSNNPVQIIPSSQNSISSNIVASVPVVQASSYSPSPTPFPVPTKSSVEAPIPISTNTPSPVPTKLSRSLEVIKQMYPDQGSVPDSDVPNEVIEMQFKTIQPGRFNIFYEIPFKGEIEQRQLEITKPFNIQTTEVTQYQWFSIMGSNPSRSRGPASINNPVENVSKNEILEFINKINQKGIGVFRLPTRAEWMYAAKAGSNEKFDCGNVIDCFDSIAWTKDNTGNNIDTSLFPIGYYPTTLPVSKKKPNSWGLFDMYGNVDELVQDFLWDPFSLPNELMIDPKGPNSGSIMTCGGNWGSNILVFQFGACSTSLSSAKEKSVFIGFRLIKDS